MEALEWFLLGCAVFMLGAIAGFVYALCFGTDDDGGTGWKNAPDYVPSDWDSRQGAENE